MKEFIGKFIHMDYDGKTIQFRLLEVKETYIHGKTPVNLDIYIPNGKIGPFTVGEFKRLFVHNCKNDGVCKGYRILSVKDKVEWQCKYHTEFKCSVVCAGEFDKLPSDLRVPVLDGLHTSIPVVDTEAAKKKLGETK